ncbi:metallophosphoesterase [Acidobacterium sp. S8]|uniref:metallophosphoesterase family protein n=1 Tax=Acidobacterium sp. S8 TaxID=1641854 RepID=UPI00131DDF8B|nr:metallophosphoesterase [Acidobacterium sp. S8]
MRLAAVADVHFKDEQREENIRQFLAVNELADALVIAGDLTNHGLPEEMRACLSVLEHVHVPIIAVLGNHDHESGHQDELAGMARVAGIHLLDGQCFEIDGVGFAGVKGFCGGFAPYELMPFGEGGIKTFVEIAEREAIKLDYGLAQLQTRVKVAITHYAPIQETVAGEPEPIFPFLGSSRLARALDRHKPTLALHGHAHHGTFTAKSQSGVSVYNVALPILRARKEPHPFVIFDL